MPFVIYSKGLRYCFILLEVEVFIHVITLASQSSFWLLDWLG